MITDAERARRREEVDAARHSAGLKGLRVTEATAADQDAYVDGEIDLDEAGRRVRARYGIV
ncbi:antitoxin VbhA family protein [Kocuria marina]|uniref:antitoxin VbhA family protein n=1 Tax=Kocuria marina TaxID=223184 RepID=UPI00346129C2